MLEPMEPTVEPAQRPARPARPTRGLPFLPTDPPQQSEAESGSAPDDDILVSSPTAEKGDGEKAKANALTPLRAHYLKKTLIQLEFHQELDAITTSAPNNISTFSFLGPPFTPPPKDTKQIDLPFLRYIFRQFVLTFPFLKDAPKDFFPDKLQPFMVSVLSRNLSPHSIFDPLEGSEGSEAATRLKLLNKLEKNLAMFLGSATKLAEKEEVVRLHQADLDRLEMIARKRQAREARIKDTFDVNVICVRTVVDKGRVRNRAHEEFIIRTRRSGQPDIYVSRRYGDFRTLADELRKIHPEEVIRPPPAKDRSVVTAPTQPTSPVTASLNGMLRTSTASTTGSNDSLPMSPPVSSDSYSTTFSSSEPSPAVRLAREKNRLTLRSYLHELLQQPVIGNSPVLRSFLTSMRTELSEEEKADAARREEADKMREEGRKRFANEVKERVEGLREAVRGVKGGLLGKDGLTRVFATIKTTSDVRDLPSDYQAVLEWARISLASTIFHHLVAADNASETLASLKRIHGLMPYFMLKAALRISNPVGMIRSVLDLFLAQPFGGRSLLQRMFTSSLVDEVRALEEDIEATKEKVDDPVLCEKIRIFVFAPKEIQDVYKFDAAAEKINILTTVLRSGEQPSLSRPQMHRVMRAHKAYQEYTRYRDSMPDSDDDEGPQDDDAWLYEDLTVLAKLYERLRDRQELIGLIFEGTTSELLKDIITIFYSPLAQVYKAASIADSIGDLQNFINDLIKTVESAEELSQEDVQRTVQVFIDLVQRHEQSFYSFVHKVHSKGEGLFDSLMRWIELFLTVVREGLGAVSDSDGPSRDKISLEFLLPHTGKEREEVLAEVDEVAKYHYKLKLAYEDKIRRRFGKTQKAANGGDADAEDEAAQDLVNGVVQDLSFGDLIKGDVDELAAEDDDDESEEESEESEEESEEDSSGSEESSSEEESVQTKPMIRSRTVGHTVEAPKRRSRSRPGEPSPDSGRSGGPPLMLRPSRSMTFHPHRSRTRDDAPPVPPLPNSTKHAAFTPSPLSPRDKPLPPNPVVRARAHSSASNGRRQLPSSRSQASNKPSPAPKKKRVELIKQPDLHHIPQLLPLFVEMMRPLLRIRQS